MFWALDLDDFNGKFCSQVLIEFIIKSINLNIQKKNLFLGKVSIN